MAIGDTVNPALGRADTRAILMGSMAGAEALGKGIAAAGQSLAEGMELGRQRKVARKGTETKIQALMKLHEGNEAMTSRLAPLLNTLQSDEVRGSEKDAIVSQIDPLVNAITAKQAQDVATAEANFDRTMRAADVFLKGEALELERKKLNPTKITPFNELGVRTAPDGRIEYRSTAIEENDKAAQKNFQERLSATADTPDDIRQLKEFRDLVAESGEGMRLLQMAQGKLGDAAGSEYTRRFQQFQTGFAQKIAKARNGAIVTDDDVRQAKQSIFGLGKTKQENLDIIDATIREYEGKQLEISKADAYLKQNGTLLGYVPSSNFNPAGGREEQQGGGTARQGTEKESDAQALARLGGNAQPQAPANSNLASQQDFNPPAFEDLSPEEQEAHRERKRNRIAARAPMAIPVPPGSAEAVIEPGRVRQPRVAEPVAPPEEEETDSDLIEGPGGVMYKRVDPAFGPSFMQKVPQADIPVDEAVEAVPVPAEPVSEEVDTTGAGVAEPTTQAPVQGAGSAARAVALQSNVQGPPLPKYSAKLAESLVYDESATLRQPVAFAPGPAERKKLRAAGNVLLNLDANHSGFKTGTKTPKRRVLEPMMVIPDDAKPETQTAAALAIGLMDNLYEQVHGKAPSKSVEERLLTKSQNAGRGREGVVHSELFAVTDNKMVNFLKTEAGIKEYAAIIREAFQDVPQLQIYLPHSQKDQGAQTDKGSSEVSLALRTLKYL